MAKAKSAFQFRALICRLIASLCDLDRYSTQLVQLGTETESSVFSRITALMEESHGRISRAELSERLRYSGSYLNRIVNKYSGRSISEYGNFFAMQRGGAAAPFHRSNDHGYCLPAWLH